MSHAMIQFTPATTIAPPVTAFTSVWQAPVSGAPLTTGPSGTMQDAYVDATQHPLRSDSPPLPKPDEPNFRLPRWAYVAALGVLALSGCKYWKKLTKRDTSKGELKGVVPQEDAGVKRTIPDKAFAIGKSRLVPMSRFSPHVESKLKQQALHSAKAKVRALFNRKFPGIRCIPSLNPAEPIVIGERTDLSHDEFRSVRKGKRSQFYYIHKLAWTEVKCRAPGKLGGVRGTHVFTLENPHKNLFH